MHCVSTQTNTFSRNILDENLFLKSGFLGIFYGILRDALHPIEEVNSFENVVAELILEPISNL